ncbi:hypothetical protein Emed_003377 [Eimeria media]
MHGRACWSSSAKCFRMNRSLHVLPRKVACSFLAASLQSASGYHHSAELHRYFTNRYHKKICPKCTRPNILPSLVCASCSHQLTDADIRSVGRDALRELILSRQANHDQSSELQSRLTLLERMQQTNASLSLTQDLLRGLPQPLASDGPGHGQARWCEELFRSFDFIVIKYPYPASAIHLASIPKTSMYDVKQLRRSHIPLLKSMQDKLTSLINLMIDLVTITSRVKASRLRVPSRAHQSTCTAQTEESEGSEDSEREAAAAVPLKDVRMQLRQLVSLGFNYPSEYSQLCLHAVVPPVANFGLFEPPYFYPLKKVLSDLEQRGSVQTFPPSAILW